MRFFTFLLTFLAMSVSAENFNIKMVNTDSSGQIMVFDPPYLKANIGDTVTFIPADALHNSKSILNLIPSSAAPWEGAMDEKITIELNVEGIYVYQCTPHLALGMIGVIQVGNPVNLQEINDNISPLESSIAINKERVKNYLSQIN
tara:strand:- start:608 stop:1045 length:438 start_codon:yes stop_codon:yes gene_type:complete